MRPAVVLLLLAAPPACSQGRGGEPLRKTDLVRLLSGVTLAPGELAALIHRSCLGFTPTSRDRADLVALGADRAVLVCDGQRYALGVGDCVTFDADLPHHFENSGSDEAVLLAVVSAGLRRS